MNKLKDLIAKSKPKSALIQNKDLLAKQREEFQRAKKQEAEKEQQQKTKRLKELQQFYEYDNRRKIVKTEQKSEELPLSVEETKEKLKDLMQPQSLPNQTDLARYRRYARAKSFHDANPDYDMKLYDEDFQQQLKQKQQFEELDSQYRSRFIEPRLGDDPQYIKQKRILIEKEKQSPRTFDQMCDEIYLWLGKVVKQWGEMLDQKYNADQKKQKGGSSYSRYNETVYDLKGLLVVLRKRGGDKDMLTSIYHIMNSCLLRQYIQANDKYLQLSIGNAPWPMGVAMLGITVKKNIQRVSHVLTEETTRKWMQAIKRVISVCQEMYPPVQMGKTVGYSVNSIL